MLEEISVKINIGPGRDLTLAAGKLAHLANGSCTVRQGDTIVFSAACSGEAKKGQDFFPLQVDYRETEAGPAQGRTALFLQIFRG